jgi:uncharacterized membrane protein
MSKLAANSTLVVALVQAIVILAVEFGWDLTTNQQGAIIGVTTAALAVIGLWFHPAVPVGPTGGTG